VSTIQEAQSRPLEINRGTLIDFDRILQVAQERAEEYQTASPCPHIVLDDFISEASIDRILAAFPSPDPEQTRVKWRAMEANTAEGKPAQRGKLDFSTRETGGLSNEYFVEPTIRQLFWELNSSTFIRFLETLTGIPNLLPDPHMQGGGIHQTARGGLLRIHADFNKHPIFDLDRRLNFLLYLNRDWKEEYGGHIELWARDMSRREKRVLPIAGRVLIFSTLSDSYHGHPEPLNCPEDMRRKSVAMYYYSNGRPAEEQRPKHATLWPKVPGEE
jgi:hypothetical protein